MPHSRVLLIVSATLLCATLWGLGHPTPSGAATYHVSTTGIDAGRSCTTATDPGTPLRTISLAVACAGPGDTVQVGPGTFTQRIDLNRSPGGSAAGGRVIIQGTLPLGSTKLVGTGLGNGWMVFGRHVTYTTIRHFEIRGHTGGGIGLFGDTTHSSITDNYVHDNAFICCQGSGIRVTTRFDPSTNTGQGIGVIGTAHHVTIARNVIKNLVTGFTGQLPNNGTESLTVAADISHFLIEDNVIDQGQFIGIDLIGKSAAWWGQIPGQRPTPPTPWPRQGIVRRNTVKNLKLGMGGGDAGIYCDGCRDIVFEQNRVDGSNGYCLAISTEEGGFLISQIIVRHNLGINCTAAPFGIGPAGSLADPEGHGESEHLRVVHNTALRTKPGGPTFRFQWAGGAQAKNNIGAAASATPVPYLWHGVAAASAAPQLDYNLYWGGNNYFEYQAIASLSLAAYQAGSGQDAHSLIADPRFTNVATRDLTLQATSPALDRGTPLTLTVGAGSGTLVTVQDARYFSDGYGMVPGDAVQVGMQLARVTTVDYATNRLTLDRTLSWTANMGVSYPFLGAAPDLGACEGVGTCTAVSPPPPTITPSVALDLTHTCGTSSNSLGARVMGSLWYLAPTATYQAETLARSRCASNVAITDSASVLPTPFSLLPPWHFVGTAGPNVSNTCTNCLAVHAGTPSVNASGSGYTLTTFQQGTSVAAATGGVSAYTALPGLCRQVVNGSVTGTPLWPWPMEARIAAARSLAGSLPVNVTTAVEAALGPIPPACVATPSQGPPDYTSALRMHLPLDEGTGTTAQDSTANNHDGTLGSGASWGPGKLGTSAVVLDGTTNGTVTVPGELTQPAAVTLAAWVWPTAFPTGTAEVLTIGNQVALRVSASTINGFYWNGTTWVGPTATHALSTTGWTHLAFTATAGSQVLYVNGTQVATSNSGAALSYVEQGTDTYLGRLGVTGTTQRFQGTIDDARVYTRVLSAHDIAGLAALGEPSALNVFITTPTTSPSYSTGAALLATLGGTTRAPTGVTRVRWNCPTCTPTLGDAVCTPACDTAPTSATWHVPSVTLSTGANLMTVTAHEAAVGTTTDSVTVTYTPPPVPGVCTHWASQAGGGNGGSVGSPFQVINFWALATPGATLCLKDDTYTGGNSMIVPPAGLAGTMSLPITIQALNDGGALLDGENLRNPVVLSSTNQWFVLRGLNARNGLTSVYQLLGNNNRGTKLIGWNATSGQLNATIFTVMGVNTIVEDCAGWGENARVILQGSGTATSPGSGYRRCWCEWNDHPGGGTTGGGCVQPGVGQFVDNVVATINKTGD